MTVARREQISALAYPTLSQAAAMLSVAPSTLSRMPDVAIIAAGARDRRLPAAEVVRLAQHFLRRPIDDIAYDLIEYAREHASRYESAITAEVDEAVAAFYERTPAPSLADFLRDAKRYLPEDVFHAVADAVAATTPRQAVVSTRTRRKATGRRAATAPSRGQRSSPKPKELEPA